MHRLKKLFPLLFVLLISIPFIAHSQYYMKAQDPASLKWHQINSNNFQIIYPRGYDSIAQYVLNTMEYGRLLTLKSKDVVPKKVSVILHNQTVTSNAEVAWAPSRMEFYTVTPQSTYSQLWYEQLALHEYVHVLQISSMNQGLTNLLSYLFGEQITVGVFGLYLPYWFIEGDAVVSETSFSKSGRGRDPNFEAVLRAQLLEIGKYSIEKAALGSYEDFTPGRYHLGYYLVGQGRVDFGKRMWNKPLENTGRYPLGIVPFSTGIKTKTSLAKKAFYEHTLDYLDTVWQQQLAKTKVDSFNKISNSTSYTDYTNNLFITDNAILSLKKDYHDIGRFVVVDSSGNEEVLFTPGYYYNEYISLGADWLCWSEAQNDPRWGYRSYTKIMMLNIKTKEKKTLLKKTRYFSANISPSGKRIVAVEVDEFSQHSLVILDAQDGCLLKKTHTPDNDFIAHPSWSGDEERIVAEVMNSHGKGLAIFDIESGHMQNVLAYGHTHLQYPTFWKHYILFEAAYSGVMDVFALDLKTKSLYQTTQTAFSASDYAVSPNSQKLLISSYTAQGKQLRMKDWKPKQWIPFSQVENKAYPLADMLSAQEDTILDSQSIPTKEYEIKKYSKLAHAFNIHSWGLLHVDANNNSINPGISLMSQNKLSTMQAVFGADYSHNTNHWRYYGKILYKGWYPVFSIGADYGQRYLDVVQGTATKRLYYHEENLNVGVSLPLLYTSGSWSFSVQPAAGFNFKNLVSHESGNIISDYLNIKSVNYSFQFGASQKTPFQNMYPNLGFGFYLIYQNTPFQSELGAQFSAGLNAYFPAFFRHDGFRLRADFQDKINDAVFYGDITAPARGYSNISYDDLLTLRADYKVPLLYPDWNLSSLLYVKRITVGGFGDYSVLPNIGTEGQNTDHSFWSSGLELAADVFFLRSKFPVNLGFRTSYVNGYYNNSQGVIFEFTYGIAL